MTSTFTPALNLEIPALGDYASTGGWAVPMDGTLTQLDTAYGGMLSLSVSGGTTVLTKAQASYPVIYVSGTLSAHQVIAFPNTVAGRRLIIPACTMGNYYLFVRGNGGADTIGVYFWQGYGIPYGIVVTPSRVYWDYGACDVGTIVAKPSTFPGNGWLPCDGRSVSQTQYDMLYPLFGGGSGGNFTLPDLRGTVSAMADQIGAVPAAGPFSANMGARGLLPGWGVSPNYVGGAVSHTLTTAELPAHAHTMIHNHTVTDPQHFHDTAWFLSGQFGVGNFNPANPERGTPGQPTAYAKTNITIDNFTGNTGNAGSGSNFNIMQPTSSLMKMIKW